MKPFEKKNHNLKAGDLTRIFRDAQHLDSATDGGAGWTLKPIYQVQCRFDDVARHIDGRAYVHGIHRLVGQDGRHFNLCR